MTGEKLLGETIKRVMLKGDSASVSLMKEIREATEGIKASIGLHGDGGPVAFEIVDPPKRDESTS